MIYRLLLAGFLCLLVLPGKGAPATSPEQMYLTDTIKVMMRSGPGIDYKIVAMPTVGQAVTVLETGEQWTRVQLSGGKKGWVLNHFISEEIPQRMQLAECREKYADILEKYKPAVKQKEALIKENAALKAEFASNVKETEERIRRLIRENKELSRANRWSHRLLLSFLYGAGVLLAGIFFGSRMKKDKQRRYLV